MLVPNNYERSTIFALASGQGRAGVSIVRVSGPQALTVIQALCASRPEVRRASVRVLRAKDGSAIDQALVLTFKGPASFTGEDMCELHVHGSPAVVEKLASCLLSHGLREAMPGEFTRRAFENGRMDLTEAEGLADLIDAETEAQRKQAYRQMEGGLRSIYEGWREAVLDALAQVEGEIDFPDEQDVPDKLAGMAGAGLDALAAELTLSLSESSSAERIRHGLDIVIIGAPNAGKSSLINGLTKKDAAIVSDVAGTTRDVVEVAMVIGGLPVRLSDTAGLRNTDDAIEAEGVRRAISRAQSADIRIAIIDGSCANSEGSDLEGLLEMLQDEDLLLINKSDINGAVATSVSRETLTVMSVSAHSATDIDRIRNQLETLVATKFPVRGHAGLTRARHRACGQTCLEAILRARQNLDLAPELAGDDLRSALHAIKELAGETDIEAVLDRIFSRFCIGK